MPALSSDGAGIFAPFYVIKENIVNLFVVLQLKM